MLHTDALHEILLCVVQLVQITVYPVQIHILVEMAFQIFHRCHLAHWLAKTCNHKMPQYIVANLIETHGIINLVENKLGTVEQYGIDVGEHLFGCLTLAVFTLGTLKIQFLYAEM